MYQNRGESFAYLRTSLGGCGPAINVFGNDQANARSQHRNGVNACFCDGSVRFVSNSTNQGIWYLLNSVGNG